MSDENKNPQDQPLFPPPGSSNTQRELEAVDGRPLAKLGPDDTVVAKANPGNPHSRDMLVPAGNVLAHDGTPIWDAPDGATEHLDPNQTTVKLGGEAVAHAFRPDDPRLER